MTRVTNADQVLLVLRERLQRLGQRRSEGRSPSKLANRDDVGPISRLRQSDALSGLSDEEMHRGLVRAMLAQEWGDAVANDAGFLRIVEDVACLLEGSAEGRNLLESAGRQIRGLD